MTLSTNNRSGPGTTCYLRSICKTEADREFVDRLFAHDWEYFVIKKDDRSDQFGTFVECCGTQLKVGQ